MHDKSSLPMIAPVFRPLPDPGSLVGGTVKIGGLQEVPPSDGTYLLLQVVQLSLLAQNLQSFTLQPTRKCSK